MEFEHQWKVLEKRVTDLERQVRGQLTGNIMIVQLGVIIGLLLRIAHELQNISLRI